MYRPRMNLMLMSALAAALSVGGTTAVAVPPATEYPDDGKFRLKHGTNDQVCEFDTPEQAADFIANVADPDDWKKVGGGWDHPAPRSLYGLTEAPEQHGQHVEVDLNELRDAVKADSATEAPAPDGDDAAAGA